MATKKSSDIPSHLPDPILDDEDDDLPMPPPRPRAGRRNADDDGGDPLDMPEPDPIPFTSDKVRDKEKLVAGRIKGKPSMPWPEELNPEHRPYWTELVNSFPKDYFTPGDIPTMKIYCRAAHDVDRCNVLIEDEGDVIMGPKGPTINPRVRVRKVSEDLIMTITTKFRNQPSARENSANGQRTMKNHATAEAGRKTAEEDEDDLLGGRAAANGKGARLQ